MRTTVESESHATRRRAAEAVLADLALAVGSLRCAGSQRLVRLGVSMTHFHVLTLLRHHEAMPMGRLADILDASMSNATGIIDRMEERGLVERVRVPGDRRIVLVRPTQAGLDLVDEVELVKNDVMIRAFARLDDAQLERLSAAVADIGAALEQEMAGDLGCSAEANASSRAHASPRSAQPAP
jgi:DNA-binding MarR family transcriptional regulator